ncbi:MAG: DUF3291 domain-containing protein [Chloroflexi bacterium]|nr:DUF3291 domain-containing protein [Chloroflexota bacterium]
MAEITSYKHHLAQVNVAKMRGPLDSPVMAGFVAQLDEINALADAAPGFVWRLQSGGDATSLRIFPDDTILINMSVWESVEALFEYTYKSDHVKVMRRRAEWFERMETAHTVLWWTPAGHIPTPDEAKARLDHLEQHGPNPHAFTFRQRFTVADLVGRP